MSHYMLYCVITTIYSLVFPFIIKLDVILRHKLITTIHNLIFILHLLTSHYMWYSITTTMYNLVFPFIIKLYVILCHKLTTTIHNLVFILHLIPTHYMWHCVKTTSYSTVFILHFSVLRCMWYCVITDHAIRTAYHISHKICWHLFLFYRDYIICNYQIHESDLPISFRVTSLALGQWSNPEGYG